MPYKGSAPKDESDRVNRIPKRFDKTVVDADEEVVIRGIDLPECSINKAKWCDRTREWWMVWRTSPNAKLMGTTDWEFMLECAIIHNELWRPRRFFEGHLEKELSGTTIANYMAELRQRVGKFGATWEDRQKLQLQITIPQTDADDEKRLTKEAKSASDYAERLIKKAAEQKEAERGNQEASTPKEGNTPG